MQYSQFQQQSKPLEFDHDFWRRSFNNFRITYDTERGAINILCRLNEVTTEAIILQFSDLHRFFDTSRKGVRDHLEILNKAKMFKCSQEPNGDWRISLGDLFQEIFKKSN